MTTGNETNEGQTRGAPNSHTGTLSYLACDTSDLVLLYQSTTRDHYPAGREFATARGPEHLQSSQPKVLRLSKLWS